MNTIERVVRIYDRTELERVLLGLMHDKVVTMDELERRLMGTRA